MEYGPEHSKLVRQVFGTEEELPAPIEHLWNNGSRNPNANRYRIPEHLRPGFRTYPQMVKDGVRNFLRALHRHTLGRFLRGR